MITIFRPRFRSRDAAIAAATRLTHLVPGHDYEAWPNRATEFSSCVIVMMTAISVSNLRNYVADATCGRVAPKGRSMPTLHIVPQDLQDLYHVHEWRNAAGILAAACPKEWADIVDALRDFRLLRSEVTAAGGDRSPISDRL